MSASDDLRGIDLLVGTILAADDHPGARAPSYLLRVDLGRRGERETSVERGSYEREELIGTQVVVAVHGEEALIVAARSHAAGLVLLRPDRAVEPGTIIA
jgi:tRNA-binding EMAP/Myf-like protein